MLRKIEIFIVLLIVFFSTGCFDRKMNNISDCENIKNEFKSDKCFVSLIENIPSDNTDLKIEICDKIIDVEIRDVCFFKIVKDGWRVMSSDNLINLCGNIISDPLRKSCEDIEGRPHLQAIR